MSPALALIEGSVTGVVDVTAPLKREESAMSMAACDWIDNNRAHITKLLKSCGMMRLLREGSERYFLQSKTESPQNQVSFSVKICLL
jgi:hypothetical protein